MSANQKYTPAEFRVAVYYTHKSEYKKALPYLISSAEKGYTLSFFFMTSIGTMVKTKKELLHIVSILDRLAVKFKFAFAWYLSGILCFDSKKAFNLDDKMAFLRMKIGADKGHAKSMHFVGICYRSGVGTVKNEKLGIKYYTMAAEKNHPTANYDLGVYYLKINETEKGFYYLRKALMYGFYFSDIKIGDVYYLKEKINKIDRKNISTNKNLQNAFKFYKIAADSGNKNAQFMVGHMYGAGEGVKRDYKKAFYYYKLSADQGHVEAQLNVGLLSYSGHLGSQDLYLCYKYIKLAADKDDNKACYVLSSCFQILQKVSRAWFSPW